MRISCELPGYPGAVIALNQRQFETAIRGDFAALDSLKSEVGLARRQKEFLEAYRQHITEHGC